MPQRASFSRAALNLLYLVFAFFIALSEEFTTKMEVFLMVRRKNVSMFLDGKTSTTVLQIKQMIHGISKKAPEEQQLIFQKEHKILEDHRTLGDYGITNQTAKAQSPALLAVAYKKDDGEFEDVDLTPLSQPPDPPTAMKQQDSSIISG